jgi:hypothetical protein
LCGTQCLKLFRVVCSLSLADSTCFIEQVYYNLTEMSRKEI